LHRVVAEHREGTRGGKRWSRDLFDVVPALIEEFGN